MSCGVGINPDGTKVSGCKSNGTCGTGGCNKLNVFNWLSDMTLPPGQEPFNVIEVRFKGTRKEFYRNKEKFELKTGDVVAVEVQGGHDIGVVSQVGELVRLQLKNKHMAENSTDIRTLYRKARQPDIEKWYSLKDKETSTLHRTRSVIKNLNLEMKLTDVEFQGDGKKATFYYTADERVDFRELIRKLADEFHVRVDMRQIGMRQEAARLGGIGSCGRELCCSTWLTDFKTVTTGAARYQNLSLNPAKLAGQCGKLKCCLNYELDSYMDALRDIPSSEVVLQTENGRAFHRKTDIFKRMMWYAVESSEARERGGQEDASAWIPLNTERVKEIIEMNKKNVRPAQLSDEKYSPAVKEEPDFKDMIGQDSINRMDRPKRKKKKNRGRGRRQENRNPQQQPGK
ncbi:MAG TPA: regulatory iron-sulfur-containing complex subunit RicT [Bacteroidia bacterium]|nr:regulatory iron-sulfur-containing complex subunit RicT [Bacteroidia bacterium]